MPSQGAVRINIDLYKENHTIAVKSLWSLRPEIERSRQQQEIYGAQGLHLPWGLEHRASPS